LVPAYIATLEDDPRRLSAMRECVGRELPAYELAIFDNADEMIVWLEDHLAEVALISLDHDLPLTQTRDGVRVDAGDGRMVADWLAARTPACPVIVHTSNEHFAPGMMRVLRDGGWTHRRIYPHDDCAWIATAWAEEIRSRMPPSPRS
jgi:DNA-binding NarL/FixJ family response regulator